MARLRGATLALKTSCRCPLVLDRVEHLRSATLALKPEDEMERKQGTVVVTGVTSGIGRALVERLVNEGYRIVGVARRKDRLEELRERYGSAFRYVAADLADARARTDLVARVRELGPLDALVNNAAECVYESPLELEAVKLSRLLELNLVAPMELCQGLAPNLSSSGRIIQISSVTARFMANAKFAPYGVTKEALERMTEALRLELHPRGIGVCVVRPGLVDTEIYSKVSGFDGAMRKIREQVPNWLLADDVAEVIIWVLQRPPAVVVSEVTVLPRGQAR